MRELVAAVKARDPQAAVEAMRKHVQPLIHLLSQPRATPAPVAPEVEQ
jgi:DNA-binding GntR family transcriptional regulator